MKPLYRQAYALKIRSPKLIFEAMADTVAVDKEGRLSVSKYLRPDTFLLKANNEKDINGTATPFYAFIKVGTNEGSTVKMGTDDNNLWIKLQMLSASRTSTE